MRGEGSDSLQMRQAAAAQLLADKELLLPGVLPEDLAAPHVLGDDDDERWDGLDAGSPTDYAAALEAYVEVCTRIQRFLCAAVPAIDDAVPIVW